MQSMPTASNNWFLSFVYAYLCFGYVYMVYMCVCTVMYVGVSMTVGVFLK